MSDTRWLEVEDDMRDAAGHFGRSLELYAAGGFGDDSLDGYRARMGFMHAMQSAHTSLEAMLLRILGLLAEDAPSGANWHADLIGRAARALPGRPAILTPVLAEAAHETRRFRHVAMRNYGGFDPQRARPAVAAAQVLTEGLYEAVNRFRETVDGD